MGQPSDRVGLAGTSAMLDQIVLACAVLPYVSQYLADDVQLMVTGEDNILRGLFLSSQFILSLFAFNEDTRNATTVW